MAVKTNAGTKRVRMERMPLLVVLEKIMIIMVLATALKITVQTEATIQALDLNK